MHAPEIELKFPVSDVHALRQKVGPAGFSLETERTLERNTLYDSVDRVLRMRGQILRLRTYGPRCTVTHKRTPPGNDQNSKYKTRIETESEVEDCSAMAEIISQLGYEPVFQYDKYRTEWVSEETRGHLVLDETPIGVWAELEGSPEWIDAMLERLGVAAESCTTDSYGRLFLRWKEASGSPAEHMTFEDVGMVAVG